TIWMAVPVLMFTAFLVPGCQSNTTSTPSKNPSRTRYTLPPPPSSAGVPNTLIVPWLPVSSSQVLMATAPATDAVPNTLWQQAWRLPPAPAGLRKGTVSCATPGCASYSARRAITGVPLPYVATNAVGIPACPVSTLNPCERRCSCRSPELCASKKPNSGADHIAFWIWSYVLNSPSRYSRGTLAFCCPNSATGNNKAIAQPIVCLLIIYELFTVSYIPVNATRALQLRSPCIAIGVYRCF